MVLESSVLLLAAQTRDCLYSIASLSDSVVAGVLC